MELLAEMSKKDIQKLDYFAKVRAALSWIEETGHGEKMLQQGLSALGLIKESLETVERERDEAQAALEEIDWTPRA